MRRVQLPTLPSGGAHREVQLSARELRLRGSSVGSLRPLPYFFCQKALFLVESSSRNQTLYSLLQLAAQRLQWQTPLQPQRYRNAAHVMPLASDYIPPATRQIHSSDYTERSAVSTRGQGPRRLTVCSTEETGKNESNSIVLCFLVLAFGGGCPKKRTAHSRTG